MLSGFLLGIDLDFFATTVKTIYHFFLLYSGKVCLEERAYALKGI